MMVVIVIVIVVMGAVVMANFGTIVRMDGG